MKTLVPRHPIRDSLSAICSWTVSTSVILRRHESSFRRTKQRLRVKPDPSFATSNTYTQDHIVFNPPSSAPSVYHTPSIFLPPNDRRRQLFAAAAGPAPEPQKARLPPPVRKPYEKQYHLTATDIEEIRRLRGEDPNVWTREKLAKKFNCSNLFVGIVCEASRERREGQQQILEAVKLKWGRRRRIAREDRVKRRETWGRDE
ncbi:MAG: hypothetical protein M1830_000026 [Pleopsidium flavum]|nr:MAG: hypothetical protein M1830_000026 [Pleopsidium flavum]